MNFSIIDTINWFVMTENADNKPEATTKTYSVLSVIIQERCLMFDA